jgi:hypothetical protein
MIDLLVDLAGCMLVGRSTGAIIRWVEPRRLPPGDEFDQAIPLTNNHISVPLLNGLSRWTTDEVKPPLWDNHTMWTLPYDPFPAPMQ